MRDLSELNINERGKPIGRLSPSATLIDAFEKRFGLKLPSDYVALLKHANGGHPQLDLFGLSGATDAPHWAVNRFYHIDENLTAPSSLWVATEKWQKILGRNSIPFASDSGGNQFFLDLSENPPSVKIAIHDEGFRAVYLAPSFADFIDGLSLDPDAI